MYTRNQKKSESEYRHINSQEDYSTTEFTQRMPNMTVINNDGDITKHLFYFYVMGVGVVIKLELNYETGNMHLFENETEVSIGKHDLSRFVFFTHKGGKSFRELECDFGCFLFESKVLYPTK